MPSIGPKDLHGLQTHKYKCRFFAQKQAQNDTGKVVAKRGTGAKGDRRFDARRGVWAMPRVEAGADFGIWKSAFPGDDEQDQENTGTNGMSAPALEK